MKSEGPFSYVWCNFGFFASFIRISCFFSSPLCMKRQIQSRVLMLNTFSTLQLICVRHEKWIISIIFLCIKHFFPYLHRQHASPVRNKAKQNVAVPVATFALTVICIPSRLRVLMRFTVALTSWLAGFLCPSMTVHLHRYVAWYWLIISSYAAASHLRVSGSGAVTWQQSLWRVLIHILIQNAGRKALLMLLCSGQLRIQMAEDPPALEGRE